MWSKNHRMEFSDSLGEGDILEGRTVSEYDAEGNLLRRTRYDGEGNVIGTYEKE